MSDDLRRHGLAALALLTFAVMSPHAARAQTSQAARDARRVDMEMRQRALWELDKLKGSGQTTRAPAKRPAYRDVAEEFQQLQLVNYSLAGVADPRVPLDYEQIRRESAEVRKRAARLKSYLSLPEAVESQKQVREPEPLTPEALRSAVGKLDALVNSFVWNPVFQRPDVVDAEQSTKASRDLAGIISLSERIRRCAEELTRTARAVAKN